MFDRRVMGRMYERARGPTDLPWHVTELPRFLPEAMARHPGGGRALDLGCGAGTHALALAQRGFAVTGLDLFPRAIELASAQARREGVSIELVVADLDTWDTAERFEVILDSGCLHSLIGGSRRRYAERIRRWLAPDGDYVLGHWGKRHVLDWRPFGPRRSTHDELVALFRPELVEQAHEETRMTDVPPPFGPTVSAHALWLRHAR